MTAISVAIMPAKVEHERGWRVLWNIYCDRALPDAVTNKTWQRIINPTSSIGALIAIYNHEVVGFLTYVEHDCTFEEKPICYVEDLYVTRKYRGPAFNIGVRLVSNIMQRLEAGEWPRVYGITRKENVAAQRLYDQFASGQSYIRYVIKSNIAGC